ncbi:hypothetical protein HDU97_009332 [Phlyctochytrium planicorne]|nr:hypothetical protein HDU97_009332 [Phlyctochytrium planicorne]
MVQLSSVLSLASLILPFASLVQAAGEQCNFAHTLQGTCGIPLACNQAGNVATRGYCPGRDDNVCCVTKPKMSSFNFVNPTPAGLKVFENSLTWRSLQLEPSAMGRFPQPHECADNISHVFCTMSNLAFTPSLAVGDLKYNIRSPMTASEKAKWTVNISGSKSNFISQLSQFYNGHIPLGTIVAGCLNPNCDGEAGDAHVGFVGNMINVVTSPTDKTKLQSAVYMIWHNNWLRKEDRNAVLLEGLGLQGQYMIDKELFEAGKIQRQWMATPWMKVVWDDKGNIVDAISVLRSLDDMDPYNAEYHVALVCPKDICGVLPPASRQIQLAK